jgi:hypothetical protein
MDEEEGGTDEKESDKRARGKRKKHPTTKNSKKQGRASRRDGD